MSSSTNEILLSRSWVYHDHIFPIHHGMERAEHLGSPDHATIYNAMIAPPYPVIIDEPGFLLLVRGSGGNSNGAGVDNVIECAVSGAHSFQRDFRTCAVIGCTETTPIDSVGRNSILDLTSPR